jgi:ADP-heptose:LPS heptosyltransferase
MLPESGPVLALGPTANWRGKQWPGERFAELAARLTRPGAPLAGAHFAVFGGPGEELSAAPVLERLPREQTYDLVGKLSLLDVAACLKRCALYVGNDSGLMHMAAAVGIPTLGLFGPSRDGIYAPWGERASYVRTPESATALLAKVAQGIDHGLMDGLTVDMAHAAACALLGGPRREN